MFLIALNAQLFSTRPPRPVGPALGWALASVAIGLLCVPGLLRAYPRFAADSHMRTSYGHAVSAAFCGTLKTSGPFDVPAELTEHPSELYEPIRTVIERRYTSMEVYCRSLTVPRIDSEPSLMWLMRAALWFDPSISTAGLGSALAASRLVILAVLCFALSRAGGSVFLTVAVAIATCGVLRALAPYQYNNNPFILGLPLLLIAVYTVSVVDLPTRPLPLAAVFAAAGALTAFCVNMRTSHTPIYLGLFACCVAALWARDRTGDRFRLRSALAIGALGFVAAFAIAHTALVRPMERLGGEGIVHHTIYHPLVLALAVPENDLARREGLRWDDLTGLAVARRVDPAVIYLSPGYERALSQYYFNLWRTQPLAVLGVYRLKFASAGSGVLKEAIRLLQQRGLPDRVARRLAAIDVSGFALIALTAATATLGWILYRRDGLALGFALMLISVASIGTLLESALIMPEFYVFYHGVLLLYVLLLPAIGIQTAADWARAPRRYAPALPL